MKFKPIPTKFESLVWKKFNIRFLWKRAVIAIAKNARARINNNGYFRKFIKKHSEIPPEGPCGPIWMGVSLFKKKISNAPALDRKIESRRQLFLLNRRPFDAWGTFLHDICNQIQKIQLLIFTEKWLPLLGFEPGTSRYQAYMLPIELS